MVGQSPAFMAVAQRIERVASCPAPVLIEGESGTGKELAARAIHYGSGRRDCAFVPVNCGALSENLLDNELFGHARGAFTGAESAVPGLIRLADTGTLFLDEIDSLPLRGQIALLRFLEDGSFRPLGTAKEEHANVRVIAASNRDVGALVERRAFREDLFFRLRVVTIRMPTLRERAGDIELLTDHFLSQYARQYGAACRRVSVDARLRLASYPWPGNVRELENTIHAELVLSDNPEITASSLIEHSAAPTTNAPSSSFPIITRQPYAAARREAIASFERAYLTGLLRSANGNVSQAARIAGKERRALGKLLKKYNLRGSQFRI